MSQSPYTAQMPNEHRPKRQKLSGEIESAREAALASFAASSSKPAPEPDAKGHLSRNRKRPLAGWDDFPIVDASGVYTTEKRALNPFAVVVKQAEPCEIDERSYVLAIRKHFGTCGTIGWEPWNLNVRSVTGCQTYEVEFIEEAGARRAIGLSDLQNSVEIQAADAGKEAIVVQWHVDWKWLVFDRGWATCQLHRLGPLHEMALPDLPQATVDPSLRLAPLPPLFSFASLEDLPSDHSVFALKTHRKRAAHPLPKRCLPAPAISIASTHTRAPEDDEGSDDGYGEQDMEIDPPEEEADDLGEADMDLDLESDAETS